MNAYVKYSIFINNYIVIGHNYRTEYNQGELDYGEMGSIWVVSTLS